MDMNWEINWQWYIQIIVIPVITVILGGIGTYFLSPRMKIKEERRAQDKETFKKFLELFPTDSMKVTFLRDYDFGGSFGYVLFKEWIKLEELLKKPDYKFLSSYRLEKKKDKLCEAIKEFNSFMSSNYSVEEDIMRMNIKFRQTYDMTEFRETQDKANELAGSVHEQYLEFISSGLKR